LKKNYGQIQTAIYLDLTMGYMDKAKGFQKSMNSVRYADGLRPGISLSVILVE